MNFHRVINMTVLIASVLLLACAAVAFYGATNSADASSARAQVLAGVSSVVALVLTFIAKFQANKILKLKVAIASLHVEKAILVSGVKR